MSDFDIPTILAQYDQRELEMERILDNLKQAKKMREYNAASKAFQQEKHQMDTRRRMFAGLGSDSKDTTR